jgi:hypothetical protein
MQAVRRRLPRAQAHRPENLSRIGTGFHDDRTRTQVPPV